MTIRWLAIATAFAGSLVFLSPGVAQARLYSPGLQDTAQQNNAVEQVQHRRHRHYRHHRPVYRPAHRAHRPHWRRHRHCWVEHRRVVTPYGRVLLRPTRVCGWR